MNSSIRVVVAGFPQSPTNTPSDVLSEAGVYFVPVILQRVKPCPARSVQTLDPSRIAEDLSLKYD